MVDQDKREYLAEFGEVTVFDNPSFDKSIVGISNDDRAIYDHDKMVEELMEDDDMTYEDAIDFISYNTIRACGYMPNAPIIMFGIEE